MNQLEWNEAIRTGKLKPKEYSLRSPFNSVNIKEKLKNTCNNWNLQMKLEKLRASASRFGLDDKYLATKQKLSEGKSKVIYQIDQICLKYQDKFEFKKEQQNLLSEKQKERIRVGPNNYSTLKTTKRQSPNSISRLANQFYQRKKPQNLRCNFKPNDKSWKDRFTESAVAAGAVGLTSLVGLTFQSAMDNNSHRNIADLYPDQTTLFKVANDDNTQFLEIVPTKIAPELDTNVDLRKPSPTSLETRNPTAISAKNFEDNQPQFATVQETPYSFLMQYYLTQGLDNEPLEPLSDVIPSDPQTTNTSNMNLTISNTNF